MYQHEHKFSVNDGQSTYSKKVVKQGGAQLRTVVTLGANQTDKEVEIGFPVENIQSVFLENVGGAVEIQTNDGAEPDDTIAIPADGFVSWIKDIDSDEVCPFQTDVAKVFLTNTVATQLRFLVLYNPTS